MHPNKTFIGPIKRGFDFLGIHFNPKGASLSQNTVQRHQQQKDQRYAQGVSSSRIGDYCKRWIAWAMNALRAAQVPIETPYLSLSPGGLFRHLEVNIMEVFDENTNVGGSKL